MAKSKKAQQESPYMVVRSSEVALKNAIKEALIEAKLIKADNKTFGASGDAPTVAISSQVATRRAVLSAFRDAGLIK